MRVVVFVAVLAASVVGVRAEEAAFRTGFAERDISPRLGMEQPGGYGKVFHQSFHDPCKARAGVFAEGEKKVVIVSVDALLLRRELVMAARKRIQEATGIPGEAVMIHATHSHSSGPTGFFYKDDFAGASELIQKLAYQDSPCANMEFVQHVEDQIVEAVKEANGKLQLSKCNVGKGMAEGIAFNRRFRMKNGLTFTHPKAGNPDIIEPAGPTDPEVGVIGAWDAKGNLTGCVVNFSCHATTNPFGISANYIFYLEKVIRGTFGPDVIVVFLAGASGDVTQVNNLTKFAQPGLEQWQRMVGATVGAEAVKVLVQEEPGALSPLAHDSTVLKIPRRKPGPERLAKCLELVAKSPKEVGPVEWTFAKEIVILDEMIKRTPEVDVEVQAIQIGPVVLVSDPAEFFVEFGLQIKKESPFPFTFPVSLANGCVGYTPTEESFGPHGGGYETRLTSHSNLEITAGTQMMQAGIDLAKKLTPGEIPTRKPAAPFRNDPWGYGNVPPEID